VPKAINGRLQILFNLSLAWFLAILGQLDDESFPESRFGQETSEWPIRELFRQPFESESLMLDFAAKGSDVTCPPAISQHLVEEVF